VSPHPIATRVELVLEAARYLGETLEPGRVYDRFHELLADSIHHDGVVVSDYDASDGLIRCEYARVEGNHVDPSTLPPLPFNPEGGMQSQVIASGEPLLVNDVQERVKGGGTFYNVERDGSVRRVPDTGPPGTRAAMMLPVKHEGRVVGVVQLMSDGDPYTPEHLELAGALVVLMSAAVRNARLHKAGEAETAARVRAEAVAAERERAANVLEAVGEGIFLVDRDGVIRLWNRAAFLLTGRPSDEACDQPIAGVLAGWEAIASQIPVAEGGASGAPVTLPLELDGAELWLSFVAVRSPEGVVYAFRDVTGERALDEAKTEFIATVSHELRTPMAGIYGAAQTLLREDVDFSAEDRRTLLQIIATQAVRLTQITEEVLLASRLDRDELPVERQRVDVAALAVETVQQMGTQLPEGTIIELDLQRELPPASADRDRLQQVLVNLLDNAIKYSPAGGRVTLAVEADAELVRLSVSDPGLGIPHAEQQRIFEKFYRLDTQLTRAGGGTGLGLYITRELVRRMGGTISVSSEPGVGSTFAVELRRA
jgi:two-component system, OmpR family, phosphate regulon sensor histidine kinase PhoR